MYVPVTNEAHEGRESCANGEGAFQTRQGLLKETGDPHAAEGAIKTVTKLDKKKKAFRELVHRGNMGKKKLKSNARIKGD